MKTTNPMAALFGKSPFKPVQAHMRVVMECVSEVPALFQALVEELLYEQEQLTDKGDYYQALIDTIISIGHAKALVTVLAEAIYREGLRMVAAGGDPMSLSRGIRVASNAVVEAIAASMSRSLPVRRRRKASIWSMTISPTWPALVIDGARASYFPRRWEPLASQSLMKGM